MIVRRMRVASKVLLIEWAESRGLPTPPGAETAQTFHYQPQKHRHFATAFGIIRSSHTSSRTNANGRQTKSEDAEGWTAQFRCEWKIHWHGMPLSPEHRFFSVHDSNHYALYRWQPNDTVWENDDPIEGLNVWDISTAHPYRPSISTNRPMIQSSGARLVKQFSYRELNHIGIRHGFTPRFSRLGLDEGHVYFREETHRWMRGEEAPEDRPPWYSLKVTGIPIADGPVWVKSCQDRHNEADRCGHGTHDRSPDLLPCWRYTRLESIVFAEVGNPMYGVRFSATRPYSATISSDIPEYLRWQRQGTEYPSKPFIRISVRAPDWKKHYYDEYSGRPLQSWAPGSWEPP